MNDEFNNETDDERTTLDKLKEWSQENIRIIVSILIVFLIAASIYSYSKRGEETVEIAEKNNDIEKILEDLSSMDSEEDAEVSDSAVTDETADESEDTATEDTDTQEEQVIPAPEKITAQETEGSFIESAQSGDGSTHLARRALAHYLEKNADSSLTNEHKIYIEDYLRKNVGFQGKVQIGTSIEFSKDLIKQAISASKNLNESQLKNLQKYSQNVRF